MFVCLQKILKHMGTGRKFRNSKVKCYKRTNMGFMSYCKYSRGHLHYLDFFMHALLHACNFINCMRHQQSQPGEQAERELLSEGSRGVSKVAVVWLPRLSDLSASTTYLTQLLLLRPIRTCATVVCMHVDLFQNKLFLRELRCDPLPKDSRNSLTRVCSHNLCSTGPFFVMLLTHIGCDG